MDHRPVRVALVLTLGCAGALGALSMTLGCNGTGPGMSGGVTDGSPSDQVSQSTACTWPTYLDDAGPGACAVGRAYVECQYPMGVVCGGGPSVSGSGTGPSGPVTGVTQLCISNDPTSCPGCTSSTGAAMCTDKCAPNQYALSCGGLPPPPLADGGQSAWTYQQPPSGCVGVGSTPGGNTYYCCPCQ